MNAKFGITTQKLAKKVMLYSRLKQECFLLSCVI